MGSKIILISVIIIGLLGIGGWYLLQQQVQKPQSVEGTSEIIKSDTPSTEIVTEPEVSVETDKQTYGKGEEIIVTIMNNSDLQITTYDQQTSCTVVLLEEQNGTEWSKIKNCFSGTPSQNVTFNSFSETVVKVLPLFDPWSPGVYRASIIFSNGTTFNLGESSIIYSIPFNVE